MSKKIEIYGLGRLGNAHGAKSAPASIPSRAGRLAVSAVPHF